MFRHPRLGRAGNPEKQQRPIGGQGGHSHFDQSPGGVPVGRRSRRARTALEDAAALEEVASGGGLGGRRQLSGEFVGIAAASVQTQLLARRPTAASANPRQATHGRRPACSPSRGTPRTDVSQAGGRPEIIDVVAWRRPYRSGYRRGALPA